MQKHVNLVDLVKSFPTNIYLQNLASIQKRTSPVKFAHLAEKSGKGSISNLSTKDLTEDVDAVNAFLRAQTQPHPGSGGSDAPEEVADGLQKAVDGMSWKQGFTKLAILMTDCPCHGAEYWPPADRRDWPDGAITDDGGRMSNALDAMIAKGISLFSAKITEVTDTMHAKFAEKFNKGTQEGNKKVVFRTFDLDGTGADFVEIIATEAKTVVVAESGRPGRPELLAKRHAYWASTVVFSD